MKRENLAGSQDLFASIKAKGKDKSTDIKIQMISVKKIDEVKNVREKYHNIDDLKNSIRIYGVQSPIKVVEKLGRYQILYGHRRFLATKELSNEDPKFSMIPGIVEKIERTDEEVIEIHLIENVDRDDLKDYEKGKALSEYKKLAKKSNTEIAERFGKGEKWVRDVLGTYEIIKSLETSLEEDDLEKFKNMPTGAIIETKGLDVEDQIYLLNQFLNNNLRQKDIRNLKKEIKEKSKNKSNTKKNNENVENNNTDKYVNVTVERKKYKLKKDENIEKLDNLIRYLEDNQYDENFLAMVKDLYKKLS